MHFLTQVLQSVDLNLVMNCEGLKRPCSHPQGKLSVIEYPLCGLCGRKKSTTEITENTEEGKMTEKVNKAHLLV